MDEDEGMEEDDELLWLIYDMYIFLVKWFIKKVFS